MQGIPPPGMPFSMQCKISTKTPRGVFVLVPKIITLVANGLKASPDSHRLRPGNLGRLPAHNKHTLGQRHR